MGYFKFFFTPTGLFYRLVPYPMHKKKFTKNPLKYYLLKVKKFHSDSVKNESARAKKNSGGGRQTPPPLACLGLMNTPPPITIFGRNSNCNY